MKVSEFLRYFNKEDLDKEILMASDAEGNSYHDIDEVCNTDDGKLIIFPVHEDISIDDDLDEDWQEEQDASHPENNSESEK